jgi:hypothetical protein
VSARLVLAGVVRLLPPDRRAWGRAMQAELAVLTGTGERWGFALSCLRVVGIEPGTRRRAGHAVLAVAALATVVAGTGSVAYGPLRWGLIAMVTVLVGVSFALGPVGHGGASQAVRAGAYVLIGGMAVEFAVSMAGKDNPGEQARWGVPVFTVLLAGCLTAFLAVTARRSAATGVVLATAAAAGVGAAGAWIGTVFLLPPIPASPARALAFGVLAAALAAFVAVSRRGGEASAALAGLTAALVCCLLVAQAVILLSSYGAARLIPDLVPAALSPADDLANSRIEIQDPYVGLLAIAFLVAATLTVGTILSRRRPVAEADATGKGKELALR